MPPLFLDNFTTSPIESDPVFASTIHVADGSFTVGAGLELERNVSPGAAVFQGNVADRPMQGFGSVRARLLAAPLDAGDFIVLELQNPIAVLSLNQFDTSSRWFLGGDTAAPVPVNLLTQDVWFGVIRGVSVGSTRPGAALWLTDPGSTWPPPAPDYSQPLIGTSTTGELVLYLGIQHVGSSAGPTRMKLSEFQWVEPTSSGGGGGPTGVAGNIGAGRQRAGII